MLQSQFCHRCGKTWWPRRPSKPARCPRCKSPYWDRPRRRKGAVAPFKEPVSKEALGRVLGHEFRKAFRQDEADDRSLMKALTVIKEMKTAGRTWQEMGERLEREFGTKLDKDQLKALVR